MEVSLRGLLAKTVELNASDLHICSGEIPSLRIQGEIQRLNSQLFSAKTVSRLADELLTDNYRAELTEQIG